MAYISINETDKTSLTSPSVVQRNTVYLPLNSSDGPSDKPVLCTSYTQFAQTFGTDPNSDSAQMTSWEYAANLLVQGLPVMVRRITHFLDSEGRNTVKDPENPSTGELPGTGLASGIIKGANPSEIKDDRTPELDPASKASSEDFEASVLWKKETPLDVTFTAGAIEGNEASSKSSYTTSVATEGGSTATSTLDSGVKYFRSFSTIPKFRITLKNLREYVGNSSADINISSIVVTVSNDSRSTAATYTVADNNIRILNNEGIDITKEEGVIVDNVATVSSLQSAIVELMNPLYSDSTATDEAVSIKVQVFTTSNNSEANPIISIRDAAFTDWAVSTELSTNAIDVEAAGYGIFRTLLPLNNQFTESVDNLTMLDANGNVNLFTAKYRHAGINGNKISVAIHCVSYDAIYLEVYNNTQKLEQYKLVNLRYKDTDGYWSAYNFSDDAEKIWSMLLANFGVDWSQIKPLGITQLGSVDSSGKPLISLKPLVTTYLELNINPSIYVDQYAGIVASLGSCSRSNRVLLSGGSNPSDDCVIGEVHKIYKRIQDKYLYNIKFISDGGYVDEYTAPSSVLVKPQLKRRYIETAMLTCAQTRGDCIAFVDIPMGIDRDDALEYFSYIATSYGTAYAPWVKKKLETGGYKWCPPSYIALETIAKSVSRGNEVYAPPAGVNRAIVSGVQDLSFEIPAEYIDYWSDNYTQFINPIVYIDGYGYCIFGQKTLYNVSLEGDNTLGSALQYLNTRLVANEIKKKIFECCIELSFEGNNLHTWLQFSTKMEELLEKLKSNNAITYYECLMDESTMSDYDIRTNHIVGTVRVAIGSTAEKFDIGFEMIPNSVKFTNIDYNESALTY